ncbi:MAG: YeeE/YedE family protein [Thermodesulfobacteria bacterium]|nr:YeeE/YedE family protein [Thermodesulfobacteriota bacterium]
MELLLGFLTGLIWGYIFQRARILRFEKHIGLLTLKDFDILKFLLTGVIVGSLGVNLLAQFGLVTYAVKPTYVLANLLGGIIYGLGWALLGYCPGTTGGALAEGAFDGFFGILGGLFGAIVFAHTYDFWKAKVLTVGALGKVTIPSLLGVSPALAGIVFSLMLLGFCLFLEKKGL